MAFKPFKKIKVGPNDAPTAKNINNFQDNVEDVIKQIVGRDELDQHLVKNVVLLAGVINPVPHQLGRNLNGWFVVRTHGSYNQVYDNQDINPSPNLLLYLLTPINVTVDIVVF